MTPNFAVLGIDTPGFHWPQLWLPVFLLWIPVILLSPIIFLALVVLSIAARTSIWRVIAIFWAILCSLPGTNVHVSTQQARVVVRIL
ncbi:hypothetical protein [Paludibaculum fermentans]|uniref:Uncharacterized protein n=1 Tax=Paludibaculum fermentans TaxID=1473598 RepID=A0A7S7SNB1_PALFE|nr:hypothetical protein [Paludibaculum fermentans]QOY90381.1 hypothetical protein IRI77_10620 [Paludibaculum fermentans]